jgi:hypothetical protein
VSGRNGEPVLHRFSEELGVIKWADRWFVTEVVEYRERGIPSGYGGAFASRDAANLYAKHLVDSEGFR